MKTFEDRKGTEHLIDINVATVKRVKATLDVDLLDVVKKPETLERLIDDPIFLCDLIYVVVDPKDITDEEFGERMAGDAIERATSALLEDLANFFPASKRGVLMKAISKLNEFQEQALKLAHQKLDSPELNESLRQMLESSGDSSTSSQGSSE